MNQRDLSILRQNAVQAVTSMSDVERELLARFYLLREPEWQIRTAMNLDEWTYASLKLRARKAICGRTSDLQDSSATAMELTLGIGVLARKLDGL